MQPPYGANKKVNDNSGQGEVDSSGNPIDGYAPFFLAIWHALCEEDTDFETAFDDFCTSNDEDVQCALACYMADIAYEMMTRQRAPMLICAQSQIETLTATMMGNPNIKPTVLYGILSQFSVQGGTNVGPRYIHSTNMYLRETTSLSSGGKNVVWSSTGSTFYLYDDSWNRFD